LLLLYHFVFFYFNTAFCFTFIHLSCYSVIILLKLLEFCITSMFSEIGHWQNRKWVDSTSIVKLTHVDEQTFFVGELFIVVHFSIDFDWLIDVHLAIFPKVSNMFITFPRCPNEISITKIFVLRWMPPRPMFNDRFDNLIIVSITNRKFLIKLQELFFFFKLFSLIYKLFFNFDSIFFLQWIKFLFFASVLFLFNLFLDLFFESFFFLFLFN